MKQGHFEEHWNDENGNPGGGVSCGRGFAISWQNGPLGRHKAGCEAEGCGKVEGYSAPGCTRRDPNGAFVEDLIQAVIGRIEYYQASEFHCVDNADALRHLREAANALDRRTRMREEREVEGTHVA